MVRWLRWHCSPDTGFEIRALAVWGRARYLSVTEAPRNTNFHTWMGKKQFYFFQTAETGNRTPDSGVKGSGANHYPRAPALWSKDITQQIQNICITFMQYWTNVEDVGPTLYKCYTNVWRVKTQALYRLPLSRQPVIYPHPPYTWDMSQCVERGALPMSLTTVRCRIPLGAGFSDKYHVSPLSILGHCFDVVYVGKTLIAQMFHLTQGKMSRPTW